MRIDIYLKLIGIFKTRSDAGKAFKAGCVSLHNRMMKSASTISEGDIYTITKPDGAVMSIEVIKIPQSNQIPRKSRSEYFRIVGPVL